MCKIKSICVIVSIIFQFGLPVDSSNIGVVYSPFVRHGDGHNTRTYTREIVKVMLEVVLDAGYGYNSVTTYGLGTPNRWPLDDQTISDCSSIIHTSMAAAEINKARNSLVMTVYQGMYNSTYEDQVKCEIAVSLKVAQEANQLFNGTVPALIYPSIVAFNDLIDSNYLHTMLTQVSVRTHELNMKFGVRIPDCANIHTRSEEIVRKVLTNYDFITCLETPNQSSFDFGSDNFEYHAIRKLLDAEKYVKNQLKLNLEMILETGWPGNLKLGPPKSLQNLLDYWGNITAWALKNKTRLFLHEAFDSPWKEDELHPSPFSGSLGRWKYNENENDLLSKDAYILKEVSVGSPGLSFLQVFDLPTLGSLIGLIFVIALITVIVLLFKRVSRIEGIAASVILNEYDVKSFFDGVDNHAVDYDGEIWEKSPYNNNLELDKNRILIEKADSGLLGKGQFGCVYKGVLTINSEETLAVAVKMTRSYAALSEIKCILSEIKMLTYIGSHVHICGILGAYTKEISSGVVYFAMELCTFGNLGSYLLNNRSVYEDNLRSTNYTGNGYGLQSANDSFMLSETQLIRWSYEIASAMNYIRCKNVIHSDLAARNVLLTSEYSVKVTDFGLSRRFYDEPNYSKKGSEPLPWKWLAPECLEFKRFSTKSDVWAYGITVWEIFSLGSTPRYNMVHAWKDLLSHFQNGGRLEKPDYAPGDIYDIMTKCWEMDPVQRPQFDEIMQSLVTLIDRDYRELSELCL